MSEIVSWWTRGSRRYLRSVKRIGLMWLALIAASPCNDVPRRAVVGGAPVAPEAFALDPATVAGQRHFARGYPTEDRGGVNAVIEIPSGTVAKFEVDDADGYIHWMRDRDHGGPREIDYLPFPVNYGMVPRTLAADGDGLDIVVLGRGVERGHVARTRVIGVLKMGDDTERDDKLVAVPVEAELANGFSRLHELAELDAYYPASRDILALWFANYWGAGATHVLGWGDAHEAAAILEDAKRAFKAARGHARASDAAAPRPRAPRPVAAFARRAAAPPPQARSGSAD